MPKKIEDAIKRGDLIPYEQVFASYSPSRQKKIKEMARHLMIAMELRRLRKKSKLSQEKLAEKMKVKREYIARIESGKQNVTLETLYAIAQATNTKFHFTFQ